MGVGGQEGNHYDPQELVDTLKVFIEEKEKRDSLEMVHLSMPELGEWGESSYSYYNSIMADELIMDYFNTREIHSYWTSAFDKEDFMTWYEKNDLDVELKMTEWTEMVNGRDYTMDSAMNLANQLQEDFTILDVTVWQYWIAVSAYDYRDGLIYVDLENQEITIPKRLWAMGNFGKFIRPGYTRIDSNVEDNSIKSVGFTGMNNDGKEEIVVVLINNSDEEKEISLEKNYENIQIFVTDNEFDLDEVEYTSDNIKLSNRSITTVVITR